MSVPAQEVPTDLHLALNDYDLGRLLTHAGAPLGVENRNFLLATEHGAFVLTILQQPPSAGDALVPLLEHYHASGLPVPAVVRTHGGEAFGACGGRAVLVCHRIDGHHPTNPTDAQCRTIGRFLGRLHVASPELTLPAYPRDGTWLRNRREQVSACLPCGDRIDLADAIDTVLSLLSREDVRTLPQGVIHGDLFRDNALFNDRGLSGVIDFHHAATGYFLYDLAVAANDWCTDTGGELDPERTTALLKAYHRERPLTKQELWFFPAFALYAAVAFWVSRLAVVAAGGEAAGLRVKNPDEFRAIVAGRVARFFYLDERAFD